jgi:DNA (cytosine-5)-methyltransferase 1
MKVKVVELFAGVGGFRLGLEGWRGKKPSSDYKDEMNSIFEVVWSNQWEPSTKAQFASDIYSARWGSEAHSNEDISNVNIGDIPKHDLLVAGFPCQDYSVATTLKNSKGLIGKKGVLWWSIQRILSEIANKPKYLLLENVDRLLISPSNQRGRDFAIILQSLNELGYAAEWRVINAADYGMPQRRRRVFILAYHISSVINQEAQECKPSNWILKKGVFANAFPCQVDMPSKEISFKLNSDVVEISENFNKTEKKVHFYSSGIMINGQVTSIKTTPNFNGQYKLLGDVTLKDEVPHSFYILDEKKDKWVYLKGAKKEYRKNSDGFEYYYAEGGMVFPDALDRPSRTIITGEGGESASRFKHVIQTKNGLRRLTPIELERLNMFPDNHTALDGITDSKRAFLMGNALVVGVVEKIGGELSERLSKK